MAEWAQLKSGPAKSSELERGHWYAVDSRRYDGTLRVQGPNAIAVTIHETYVRIIDREPSHITRVQRTRNAARQSGQRTAMLEFYGVCPRGHVIETVGLTDSPVQCEECGREYPVEGEEHISESYG